VLGDSSPDGNGEIGYASNAYTLFANSEDLSLTAGTNMWTFNSSTSAALTFTPAVTITGLATLSAGATIADSQVLTFDESAADPNDADIQVSATDGVLKFAAANGANNETLTINLDSTANTAVVGTDSGVTAIDLGSINMVSTGTISGATPSTADADGDTLTAAEQYGYMHWATGAGTWNLAGAAAGMSVCVYSTTAAAVVINPDDGDTIVLNGTAFSAGDSITSASGAGDFVCLVARDANTWHTLGRSGAWTDTN